MEIERKFLIKDLHSLPFSIEAYPHRELEQAYLCTGPVVRIRKDDEQYFLTYKSKGLMIREEYNLPLNRQAYLHSVQYSILSMGCVLYFCVVI